MASFYRCLRKGEKLAICVHAEAFFIETFWCRWSQSCHCIVAVFRLWLCFAGWAGGVQTHTLTDAGKWFVPSVTYCGGREFALNIKAAGRQHQSTKANRWRAGYALRWDDSSVYQRGIYEPVLNRMMASPLILSRWYGVCLSLGLSAYCRTGWWFVMSSCEQFVPEIFLWNSFQPQIAEKTISHTRGQTSAKAQ